MQPAFAAETFFFDEEFNQERIPGILDSDKWVVYPNKRTTPNVVGCMFDTVNETAGFLKLKQCTQTPQFPYIISKTNPFPDGNFTATVRFKYVDLLSRGNGIEFVDIAPENGAGFTNLFGLGTWEVIAGNPGTTTLYLTYKDQPVAFVSPDFNFHEFKVEKVNDIYKLYLDNILMFTSPSTQERVKAVFFGNPSVLSQVDAWGQVWIDYIRVTNDGPSTPQPFLDLPWNYGANGMTFNESATSITSFLDHEYPLLSVGLSLDEPLEAQGTVRDFSGGERNNIKPYTKHDGYDYANKAHVKLGVPVLAAADGEASFMSSCGACGNAILIDHKNGYQTRYYHMQPDGLITNVPGQKVNVLKGQQIGKVGFTGNVSPAGEGGSHLHFMVVQDKNNDGNFEDNIPDGITDPFGWQSSEPDPWENYSFNYAGKARTGNKSNYLFTTKLDNLNANLSSNAAVFEIGKAKLEFPPGSTNENLNIKADSAPNFANNLLNSLGSILKVEAKNERSSPEGNAGQAITTFLKNFSLTLSFSQFDLSRYDLNTLSIYSSPDGQNWTKENTQVDLNNKTASTSINHLTYFALMAERKDIVAPVTTPVLEGDKGSANNFRSDVKLNLNSVDNEGGLGVEFTAYAIGNEDWQTYTTPLTFSDEGNYKLTFYSQDKDGNIEEAKTVEFLIDKTPPEVNMSSPKEGDIFVLNQTASTNYSCTDAGGSELQSCQGAVDNGANINTGTPGANTFQVGASDNAGNLTTKEINYKVQYASGGLCNSEPGHVILQPVNPDGSSIFKQGSTVPAKFRVCDSNGVSISSPGLVKSFNLIKTVSGTSTTTINEPVNSTTPDSSFRFDPTGKQWIFNISTKPLSPGKTYFYKAALNDLTDFQFSFGLR